MPAAPYLLAYPVVKLVKSNLVTQSKNCILSLDVPIGSYGFVYLPEVAVIVGSLFVSEILLTLHRCQHVDSHKVVICGWFVEIDKETPFNLNLKVKSIV
jgi:hypothetical protein